MSFHEKNAWACLVAVLVVYTPYFYFVNQVPVTSIMLFIVAVVFLAVLLTIFHSVNGLLSPHAKSGGEKPQPDERDRLIDLRATKVSGMVLGFCVIVWCINAMLRFPLIGFGNMATRSLSNPDSEVDFSSFSISAIDAIWWVQLLFAGFVFANLVYYSTVIVLYRRSS